MTFSLFIFLAHLIFFGTEEVSWSLQRVENNLQGVLCSIETLIKYLFKIKTDEYFIIFFQGIQTEAKSLKDEPSLPRPRKSPSRFADYLPTPTRYETIYDFYHHQYFEVINKIINSHDSRLQQSVFPLLCKVEKFILSAANSTKEDDNITLNDIKEFLVDDVDVERLERELTMLPDYFSTVNKETNLNLKGITKISTICELLNTEPVGKTLFCEYHKLLLLYLIIQTTTATAERSFSALNRIKTHLRGTMTQQQLNLCYYSSYTQRKIRSA